jgi:hypothetical protein
VRILGAIAVGLALAGGCKPARPLPPAAVLAPAAAPPAARPPAPSVLLVPPARGVLKLDGELVEEDWRRAARTDPFRDAAGRLARPHSEARLLWQGRTLFMALYAADEDIRATAATHDSPLAGDDHFVLRFADERGGGASVIEISAAGVVADAREDAAGARDTTWESAVRLGVERDGTLNDPRDDDEEWVVEAAVPLSALGQAARPGARLRLSIERCDTPHDGRRRCGAWGQGPGGEVVGIVELGD